MIAVPVLFSYSAACKKIVSIPPPGGMVTAAAVFSNDEDAERDMKGVYYDMMSNIQSLANGGMSIFGGLASDEIYRTTPNKFEDAFAANALADDNTLCNNLFKWAYQSINHCNEIIENVVDPKISKVSKGMQVRLQAEAKMVRAIIFFYLVNLYGDVPLVKSTRYDVNDTLSRAPVSAVYQQMTADLQDARLGLPDSYPATEHSENIHLRPNRAVATALLARVSLYLHDWANAEQQASLLINDSAYQLEMDLDKAFLSTSREAIWALHPVLDGMFTAEASLFIPFQGRPPTYVLTPWLLNSFEPSDLRLSHWTDTIIDNGIWYFYPAKYKARDATAPEEDVIVLRLSEQYLIRAEARVRQRDTAGALRDLNIIRRRAGLSDLIHIDEDKLLRAIYHERRVEFFAEWGHRWLDLQRTGMIDSVLSQEKSGWRHDAALFPLPHKDLELDPNLRQNPGY